MSDRAQNPVGAQHSLGERTVAVLTPRGRSAVAVVSVCAEPEVLDAAPPLFRAANGRPLTDQPMDYVCFGRWAGEGGEEVVVCRTSPGVTEISCHGGPAAVARIVCDLERRGCRRLSWQEALRAGRTMLQVECADALSRAPTLRTASVVLEQSAGLLEHAVRSLLAAQPDELAQQLDALLQWERFGTHLSRPWQVVLIGLPNVGKSSLINRLLGYCRSIVYAEPGTTRDVVTAATAFEGWPVELSDTAGLRGGAGAVEAAGMERACRRAAAADLVLFVLDRSRPLATEEQQWIQQLPGALLVAHKSDLPCAWSGETQASALPVSSLTGAGVDALIEAIARRLVPQVPPRGTPIPLTERQVACLQSAREAVTAGNVAAAVRQVEQVLTGITTETWRSRTERPSQP